MDRKQKISAHFTLGELIRSATADRKGIDNLPPAEIIPKLKRLCEEVLEPIRSHYDIPFRPNSGYRSPGLNSEIGGSANSQHCLGEAVDIELHGVSNFELAQWVEQNLAYDQLILECYRQDEPTSGWVHISLKENSQANRKVALTYSKRKFLSGLVA